MRTVLTYVLVIAGGILAGIGGSQVYKALAKPIAVAERQPAALYKELFITQALPRALTMKVQGNTLKVSEMLALAATHSGFGHSPSDPGDCIINILGEEGISEFEEEVIKELSLTQYDAL